MFSLRNRFQIFDGFFISVFLSRLHIKFGDCFNRIGISGFGSFSKIFFGFLYVRANHTFGFVVGQPQEIVGLGDFHRFGFAETVHRFEFVHFCPHAVEIEFS